MRTKPDLGLWTTTVAREHGVQKHFNRIAHRTYAFCPSRVGSLLQEGEGSRREKEGKGRRRKY
jgi:hypothetical protein